MEANEVKLEPATGTQSDALTAERAIREFGRLNPGIVNRKGYMEGFSWQRVLSQPTFSGMAGFGTEIEKLEGVAEWETFTRDPETKEEIALDYKTIVGAKSKKVFSVNSGQYKAVFDQDVFKPIFNAVSEFENPKIFGRFDGVGSGRTIGHLFFQGDDFEFTPSRHDWKESPTMLGIRVNNSYNTELSYGMGFFGVRKICTNYAVYDKLLGAISFRHVGDLKNIAVQFETMLKGVFNSLGFLKKKMEDAAQIPVLMTDVEDALWGIEMPIRGIEEIKEHPFEYVPEVRKIDDFTLLDLYNAATAYVTYRPRSALHLTATTGHAKNVVGLLSGRDYQKLLDLGKEKRLAYEEAKKEAAKKGEKIAEKNPVIAGGRA